MIPGYPALLLNLLTILFLGVLAGSVIGTIVTGLLRRRVHQLDLHGRRWLVWLAALFPLLAGWVAVLLSLLPEWLPPSSVWLAGLIHWHHPYQFVPTSWHGVFLLCCSLLIIGHVVAGIRTAIAEHARYRLLGEMGSSHASGLTEVDTLAPMAFVAGLWRPNAFITSGLAGQVTGQEAQIISLHEHAHVRRRDPLKKALFRVLISVYPAAARGVLQAEMDLVLEQSADECVLQCYPDKSAVAKALLRVATLQARFHHSMPSVAGACHFAEHAIARRVQHLLGTHRYQRLPVLPYMTLLLLALLCSAASVDFLHHSLETFFLH